MLSDGWAAATIRADELTAQISDLRDRWSGRTARQGDHPEKLRIELEQQLEEQKALQRQRPIEADILGRSRAWLASLPPRAVFEQIIPDRLHVHRINFVELGLSDLQHWLIAVCRSSIVDDDVQTAKDLLCCFNRIAYLGTHCDVAPDGRRSVSDFGADASRTCFVDVDDRNKGTLSGEKPRNLGAEARRGPGH
jgi:hypothetical protein